MKSVLRASVLIAGFLAGMTTAQANLVKNGDFESGSRGKNVPNWTFANPVGYGGVNNAQFAPSTSPTGGNYFFSELWTGVYDPVRIPEIGSISQRIDGLTVGQSYRLTFWSTGTDWLAQDEYSFWKVNFGSDEKDGTHVTPYTNHYRYDSTGKFVDNGDAFTQSQPWVLNTLEFIAGATSQVLSFAQTNFTPNHAPNGTPSLLFLDGINLEEFTPANKIPEPGTASLMVAGLLAAAALSKRKKRSEGNATAQ